MRWYAARQRTCESDVRYAQSAANVEEAGPSTPVNVTGLDIAPAAGDKFYVLDDIAVGPRNRASNGTIKRGWQRLGTGAPAHVTLENLFERLGTASRCKR